MMPMPPFLPTADPHRFAFRLEPDHPAFEGHFPGQPILPGVLQVDWAIRQGEQVFGTLGAFHRVTQLKFVRPITPGEPMTLSLAFDPERRALAFTYEGPEGRRASGLIHFL